MKDVVLYHNESVGSHCTKDDRPGTNGHLFPDIRIDNLTYQIIIEVCIYILLYMYILSI